MRAQSTEDVGGEETRSNHNLWDCDSFGPLGKDLEGFGKAALVLTPITGETESELKVDQTYTKGQMMEWNNGTI